MGCCSSRPYFYWQENERIYREWEEHPQKSQGISELKMRLCLSQFGEIPLDRKLLWLRVAPGRDFPIVVTRDITKEQLSKEIIPRIVSKYDKRVSFVRLDGEQIPENLWEDTRDGQYLVFETFYRNERSIRRWNT
nr:putative adenylate kinase [Marseillevirus futianmevirus]